MHLWFKLSVGGAPSLKESLPDHLKITDILEESLGLPYNRSDFILHQPEMGGILNQSTVVDIGSDHANTKHMVA